MATKVTDPALLAILNGGSAPATALATPPADQGAPAADTATAGQQNPDGSYSPAKVVIHLAPKKVTDPAILQQLNAPDQAAAPTGLYNNATAGVNDALYRVAGAPVDLANSALRLGAAGLHALGGPDIELPVDTAGGHQSIADAMAHVGVNDPSKVVSGGEGDTLARAAGSGLGYAVAPEAALAALSKLGVVGPAAVQLLAHLAGKAETPGAVAANAAAGAVSGTAAQGASDVAPEPLKPLAATLGGLAGGAVAAGANAVPGMVRAGGKLASDFAAPLTQAGREGVAGQTLVDAATNPAAVKQSIADAGSDLVPGSKPTTFQQTGDMGLGALERGVAARNPAEFNQRRADQNTARTSAVEGIQATGAPEQVVPAVRQHVANVQNQADASVAAQQQQAVAADAANGPGLTPEASGDALRSAYEGARSNTKADERALWDAVDPDKTLALAPEQTTAAAAKIQAEIPASAKPPAGEEAAVYGVLNQYGDVVPFSELTAVQSRLKGAMREEVLANGDSPAYRRMTQLNNAIQGDLETAVASKVAQDGHAGGAGQMAPADAVAARAGRLGTPNADTSAIYTPSGRRVGVDYRVIDASQAIPSQLPDMRANPAYPPALQPRSRDRAASELQVAKIAGNLQPERLGVSPSAAEGAPILGPDNMVESGNARMLALQRMHDQNGPAAASYRQFLQSQGFSTDGMKAPVLVRMRTTPLSDAERVRFAQEANASPTLSMSASERAGADAARLDGATLGLYRGGDVASAENRDFVRSFLKNVTHNGEEGAFVTRDGSLSLEGAQRVRSALLRSAYDDAPLIEALADAGDENVRSFGAALSSVAGDMARLKHGIKDGRIDPGADVSTVFVAAAKFVQDARKRGVSLPDALAQQDAFNNTSADVVKVLQFAYGDSLAGRISRSRFEEIARAAVSEAEQQTTEARLFGQASSVSEILSGASARYGRQNGTSSRIAYGPGDIGAGGGESGAPAPGLTADATGQGSADRSKQIIGGEDLQPNFDQAALDRLSAARAATKSRVETFDNKTLAPIRARPGKTSPYNMGASAVPERIFFPGQKSADAINTYRAAVGDAHALPILEQYAVDRLRRTALRDDGTLDPGKIAQFRRAHADALRSFPALDAKFADAAKASDALAETATAAKASVDAAQQGAIGKILGLSDPADVTRTIGRIFARQDAIKEMSGLRRAITGNRDAEEGLRKAVVDHILDRFVSNTEAATSGLGTVKSDQFQTFVAQNKGALNAAGFTNADLDLMDNVAADLQRANRSIAAVKLPGGSNTTQDILASKANDAPATMIMKIVAATALGGGAGSVVGGPVIGTAAGIATGVLGVLRQQGVAKIDDLVRQAMLDPQLARMLMMKVKPEQVKAAAVSIGQRFRRSSLAGAAAAQ